MRLTLQELQQLYEALEQSSQAPGLSPLPQEQSSQAPGLLLEQQLLLELLLFLEQWLLLELQLLLDQLLVALQLDCPQEQWLEWQRCQEPCLGQ